MATFSLSGPNIGQSEIRVGDVVELKSGGVPMTVEQIGSDRAKCVWQDGAAYQAATYSLMVLRRHVSPGVVLITP